MLKTIILIKSINNAPPHPAQLFCAERGTHLLLMALQAHIATRENRTKISFKGKIELQYSLVVLLLPKYAKEMKSLVLHLCVYAALLTTANMKRRWRCGLINERVGQESRVHVQLE